MCLTEFVRRVAEKTGIILDPVYTGKAVLGMVAELKANPSRFKGRRILYLHTGEVLYDVILVQHVPESSKLSSKLLFTGFCKPVIQFHVVVVRMCT